MGGIGSGGKGRRKKIYSDPAHENLRQRVARFRERNAARLAMELEQRKLLRLDGKIRKGDLCFLLWEIVGEAGRITGVKICRSDTEPPANSQRSEWLPNSPVNYKMARQLKVARLAQLAAWRGEC